MSISFTPYPCAKPPEADGPRFFNRAKARTLKDPTHAAICAAQQKGESYEMRTAIIPLLKQALAAQQGSVQAVLCGAIPLRPTACYLECRCTAQNVHLLLNQAGTGCPAAQLPGRILTASPFTHQTQHTLMVYILLLQSRLPVP